MKNTKHKLGKTLATLTYHVAKKGAGLASNCGIYQPKVPKKLVK